MSRPQRKLSDKEMGQLIESLRGSTGDEEEALRDIRPDLKWSDLTPADLFDFDMAVFYCALCNWWCGTDELSEEEHSSGEQVCQECYDES
jgi:hypothetical protein